MQQSLETRTYERAPSLARNPSDFSIFLKNCIFLVSAFFAGNREVTYF